MEFYKGKKFGDSDRELELIKELDLDTLNRYIFSHEEINSLSFAVVTGKDTK
jgi:hypothetical protein